MRVRLVAPRTFDFAELADGVRRNNVGVEGISLQAEVRCADGRVELQPTGQSFPLAGEAPRDGWCLLVVHDWDEPARTRVEAQAIEPPAVPAGDAAPDGG